MFNPSTGQILKYMGYLCKQAKSVALEKIEITFKNTIRSHEEISHLWNLSLFNHAFGQLQIPGKCLSSGF